jgi:hypothetical protein
MLLTGHKTRAVFDRYNIVNEQELLTAGGAARGLRREERFLAPAVVFKTTAIR